MPTTRFDSKIDTWLIALIGASLVVSAAMPFWLAVTTGQTSTLWLTLAVLAPTLALILWLFRSTAYNVDASQLLVTTGPFRWVVALAEIEGVSDTRSPRSAPALSLDRLEIRYSGGQRLLVSPKDKAGFRAALGHPS